ncbi:MAG: glycosyltransferase [Thermoleophilaceae bacterium]
MRILQAFEPPQGGVRVHVEALVGGLVRRGHEVAVVVSKHSPSTGAELAELGAQVHTADLVPELLAARANARALGELTRILRRGHYDVAHFHDAKAGALGRPAAAIARTPALYSPHAFVYRSQHLRERSGVGARRALTLNVERVLGRMSTVVCISRDEHDTALHDRVAGEDRLRVAYYGIVANGAVQPDAALTAFRDEGPLLGFMARLQDQKGLPDLIAALAILRDRGTLPRFAIVGSGPMEGWVVERLAEESFGDRVLLQPFEPPVWPRLAAFDAFVLPSLWEGLPIAVLEAMAAGLPVVSTTVNGIPEAVEHEESGLLVPPSDPPALADAIERVAADADLRARMGEAGRRRYEERFTLERMIDRFEELYAEAAAR